MNRVRDGAAGGRARTLGSVLEGSHAWVAIVPFENHIPPDAVRSGGAVLFRLDLEQRVVRVAEHAPGEACAAPLPDAVQRARAFPDAPLCQLRLLTPVEDAKRASELAGLQLPALMPSRIFGFEKIALHVRPVPCARLDLTIACAVVRCSHALSNAGAGAAA